MYTQPVKVGDEITVEIVNLGNKGSGTAKFKKFVIFVEKGELEKKYKVKVKKVFNNFATAEIIKEVH